MLMGITMGTPHDRWESSSAEAQVPQISLWLSGPIKLCMAQLELGLALVIVPVVGLGPERMPIRTR